MIAIIDFGSQTTHLIARRIREFGVKTLIIHPEDATSDSLKDFRGIIFSGGPSSVYSSKVPKIDKKIFDLGKPILGICYGFQLMAHMLGGEVKGGKKEYGPALLNSKSFQEGLIMRNLPIEFTVWMNHGDEIRKLPRGFEVLASTQDGENAFVADREKRFFGILFHPEVEHTEYGREILHNFIEVCGLEISDETIDIQALIESIRSQVGGGYVIGAVSGGVDSTVAGALTAQAIGDHFIPVFVDNGLMRVGTGEQVKKIFSHLGVSADVVDVRREMLKLLAGVEEPEKKRKVIGNFYIEVFEREMRRLEKKGLKIEYLMQGTIYSDVIESKGTKHAAKIKSHHNVGGLPKKMKLKLLEPIRDFYKDEVRKIGYELGLPGEFVQKQPFPGPGYAIRIRGEVTRKRLVMQQQADAIVLEELEKAGILSEVFQSFPVLTGAHSTAQKGDGRHFGEVVALRVVESTDVMTSTWAKIPYDVLEKISSRIVNEVPDISRVVYDITTKPPATMEWE